MAGAAGIEPANHGIKTRCLTTWLRPNIQKLINELCAIPVTAHTTLGGLPVICNAASGDNCILCILAALYLAGTPDPPPLNQAPHSCLKNLQIPLRHYRLAIRKGEPLMKEIAWAIMFMIPWPNTTNNKVVIYTFPTEQECVASIPSVKRKHRLFFKGVSCSPLVRKPA